MSKTRGVPRAYTSPSTCKDLQAVMRSRSASTSNRVLRKQMNYLRTETIPSQVWISETLTRNLRSRLPHPFHPSSENNPVPVTILISWIHREHLDQTATAGSAKASSWRPSTMKWVGRRSITWWPKLKETQLSLAQIVLHRASTLRYRRALF